MWLVLEVWWYTPHHCFMWTSQIDQKLWWYKLEIWSSMCFHFMPPELLLLLTDCITYPRPDTSSASLLVQEAQGIDSVWWFYIDGLVQKIRNSSALAMELRLFYIKPSICIGIPFVVLAYLISIMDFSVVIRDGRVPDCSISIANSLEVFVSHQAIAKTTFSH